jgi:hypothetical protein
MVEHKDQQQEIIISSTKFDLDEGNGEDLCVTETFEFRSTSTN